MNFANFFLSLSLVFCLSAHGYSIDKDPEKSGGIKEEIKEYITHHLKDSHSFGVASYTKENGEKVYIEIPLPVILYDNGFKFFMSSEFKHGKKWFLVMITTTECIMIKIESIKQIVKEHLFMMTPIN